ncbi:hypothetical protein IB277_31870 [Ensifer sp. ENS07]|uniref:hypothetical protein n=1 Tax=Ensifer sp. ENS07 TaxID=2769274 RepID=UPI00177B25E8|nr:hypothetical protein [Ensifer sp. ENS07]MBD9640900.1 hypothetical protein [Ensifer sp. ENS07]
MRTIAHLTLDTGHIRNSPRSEVHRDVVDVLSPIVRGGKGEVAGWDIQMIHGAAPGSVGFALNHGGLWIASSYMAWTQEGDGAQWDVIRKLYQPNMMKPTCSPWLAVKLMSGSAGAGFDVMMEAGDLERCIAWTVLDVFGERASA